MEIHCFFRNILFVSLLLAVVQIAVAKDCSKPCPKCPTVEKCAPGVNLIGDECGCCKTCARQLHESCNTENLCDKKKNLYCSFDDSSEQSGICVSTPGRSCFFDRKVFLSGETFVRSCKSVCTCLDGDVACFPLCPVTPRIPKGCPHFRLVRKPGQCCSEWICDHTPNQFKSELLRRLTKTTGSSKSTDAIERSRKTFQLREKNECVLQSTEWSPCSKTCGWGVSERVSNANKACKLRKQTRLCQVRPCEETALPKTKGKKCKRLSAAKKPVRFAFTGCKSKVFVPKYCGECNDGRTCMPARTKTVSVTFHCSDGFTFKKKIMQIKSCSCRRRSLANEIFGNGGESKELMSNNP